MFRYPILIEDALLGVVKAVLKDVSLNGFSNEQHFYITFRTQHPGVEIPPFLKKEHPETVTIVLQYEFDSLRVSDSHFGVRLRFNQTHHFLHIPFEAITAFSDPSESFQLSFSHATQQEFKPVETGAFDLLHERDENKIISLDAFRKKS